MNPTISLNFTRFLIPLIFVLFSIQLACYSHTTVHAQTTCTSSQGCGARAFLADLQQEYTQLNCISNKLNNTISILLATNSSALTSQIQTRVKQLKKVEDAKQMLSLEMAPLSDKCNKQDGDNCDLACFGLAPSKYPTTVCSGHGVCSSLDNCSCYPGWSGSNCSLTTCYGILASNTSYVCNGRGSCVSNNTCVCNSGVFGSYCEAYNITGDDTTGRRMANGQSKASCLQYYQANPYAVSGMYYIKPQTTDILVYCNMNMTGTGGFTFVRRVAGADWWPLNDNFGGGGSGTYDPRKSLTAGVTFGLDYSYIPRTQVLITTGDGVHWIYLNLDQVTSGYGGSDCTTVITILSSSVSYNTPYTVQACKRGNAEDPWLTTHNHGYMPSESESHSMLWGESGYSGVWLYWKSNHNGINVFIR